MGTMITADDIKEASSDWNLKEIKEVLGIVKDILGAKQQEAPPSKLHGSPRAIQDNKNPIQKEVAKPMQVDTGQLKIFFSDDDINNIKVIHNYLKSFKISHSNASFIIYDTSTGTKKEITS